MNRYKSCSFDKNVHVYVFFIGTNSAPPGYASVYSMTWPNGVIVYIWK